VSRPPAFWDSSALVPACVVENSSPFVKQQIRRWTLVVWWGTSVEVTGAICRLNRIGELTVKQRHGAGMRLKLLKQAWREILPSDIVRDYAEQVVEKHGLKAGDSFQLAAALVWCQGRTTRQTFVCGDERLSVAARAEGFSVVALPRA
jgi:uncharacterized protein